MSYQELNRLYLEMLEAWSLWCSVPRPRDQNWSAHSIAGTPVYFEKFSSFRSKEWDRYVEARDIYFKALRMRAGVE